MHTLEATICISLIILTLVGVMGLSQDFYHHTRAAAEVVASGCIERLSGSGLYEVVYSAQSVIDWPQVRTSPAKLSGWAAAWRESSIPLRAWMSSIQAGMK